MGNLEAEYYHRKHEYIEDRTGSESEAHQFWKEAPHEVLSPEKKTWGNTVHFFAHSI